VNRRLFTALELVPVSILGAALFLWPFVAGGAPAAAVVLRRRPPRQLRSHAVERVEVAPAAAARHEMRVEDTALGRVDVVVEIRDQCLLAIAAVGTRNVIHVIHVVHNRTFFASSRRITVSP